MGTNIYMHKVDNQGDGIRRPDTRYRPRDMVDTFYDAQDDDEVYVVSEKLDSYQKRFTRIMELHI